MEKKKRKILYLITKSNFGGAQRYVYDLARAINSDVYDIAVACGGEGVLTDKLREKNIRVIPIASLARDISILAELRAIVSLFQIISKEKPDILHTNSSKAALFGGLIGRITRVPTIIFTAHGWAFNEDRSELQKNALKLLHWVTVLLSDATIAVSRSTKAQMDWPLAQKRMHVINPGRDVTHFYTKHEAREKLSENSPTLATSVHDRWIGTIAELHPIKRIDIAIHAFKALLPEYPALRYVIIGDGEQYAELQHLITKLELTKYVFLTGSIVEAAELLPAFDVFTLTSKSESYGYVVLEAGLAHVPVVASNVGGIPDIVTHGESGLLVPPMNIQALAEALDSVLKNRAAANAYSEKLHAFAATRTIDAMTRETLALYDAQRD